MQKQEILFKLEKRADGDLFRNNIPIEKTGDSNT